METWALINSKGGVGKSTITINVARFLSKKFNVLVIDADTQGSIRIWDRKINGSYFDVVGLDSKQMLRNLKKTVQVDAYDYCLIDTPGKISDIIAIAIGIADKIIIPVQPSSLDIDASLDIVDFVKSRKDTKASFLINRQHSQTILSREVRNILKEHELPILKQAIAERTSYAKSIGVGLTVYEDRDLKARQEIDSLASELINL